MPRPRALSRLFPLLAALAALAPTAGESFAAPPPVRSADIVVPPLALEKYTLDNGLEVVLHEDHRTPTIAVNVWYHVGSKDEPATKNGFAHLFEHLMFQGSRNVGEDRFFQYLEAAGASEHNGTTNTDRTNYFETVPTNQLSLALWLESDRMGFLLDHVDEKTFKEQREVVKNERRQSYENAPYGMVSQFIREAAYPKGHPYQLLTIGTPEDLDRASLDDVRAFYRRYYVPNNATLVIAGDLDPARTKELVQKYFGSLKRGADAGSLKTPVPDGPRSGEKRLSVEADVELARVMMVWPTPPHFAPGDAELDLLSQVLSDGRTSRLYKRLVYDLKLAQDVWAAQGSRALGSQFEIGVNLRKGADVDKVLAVLDEEIEKVRAGAPTSDELERAKTSSIAPLVFGLESLTSRANLLNQYNQSAGDPAFLQKDVARYQRATGEDVRRVAEQSLVKDARVVVVVKPTPGAPRAGRLEGASR
jgi:zinc protease